MILRGKDDSTVRAYAREMAKIIHVRAGEIGSDVRVLGPAPAPLTRLKGLFRYHLQLTHEDVDEVRRLWNEATAHFPPSNEVEFVVDVDPFNMR